MIVSLNEIETTILKAARGAGMEWGLAEEAAQAARFLARLGLPFEVPFVFLLASGAWRTHPILDGMVLRPNAADAWLCPIRAGAYLSDLGEEAPTIIERVLSPMLLLPFAARRSASVALAWGKLNVRLDSPMVALASTDACALTAGHAEEVTVTASEGSCDDKNLRPLPIGGTTVDETSWAKLQSYEAMTYVPASAKSRLSGAGAGAIDND
jgi:Protein of unknown function (DUF3726)